MCSVKKAYLFHMSGTRMSSIQHTHPIIQTFMYEWSSENDYLKKQYLHNKAALHSVLVKCVYSPHIIIDFSSPFVSLSMKPIHFILYHIIKTGHK